MTEDEGKLALPASSYDVLAKILHAYALCGDTPVSLDAVAGKAGMHKTQVSANNGFLVSLGLLSSGKSKSLTAIGKKLAIAIGNELDEDAALEWRRALLEAPSAKGIIDMIRVQKGIPSSALAGRIASTLGLPGGAGTTTGVNSLIEILMKSGVIEETDGKFHLTPSAAEASTTGSSPEKITGTKPPGGEAVEARNANADKAKPAAQDSGSGAQTFPIPIHVNIELHLPASSEQTVYDALFKSIRENLLNSK
jgi:hypothetical protein